MEDRFGGGDFSDEEEEEDLGCNGGDSCCNSNNRCGEGEGDCDSNSDCNAGLLCGSDNCAGSGFDSDDDCCYNPSLPCPMVDTDTGPNGNLIHSETTDTWEECGTLCEETQ